MACPRSCKCGVRETIDGYVPREQWRMLPAPGYSALLVSRSVRMYEYEVINQCFFAVWCPYLEVINMHIESCMQNQPFDIPSIPAHYCFLTSPAAGFNGCHKMVVGIIELVIRRIQIAVSIIVSLAEEKAIVCQYSYPYPTLQETTLSYVIRNKLTP